MFLAFTKPDKTVYIGSVHTHTKKKKKKREQLIRKAARRDTGLKQVQGSHVQMQGLEDKGLWCYTRRFQFRSAGDGKPRRLLGVRRDTKEGWHSGGG